MNLLATRVTNRLVKVGAVSSDSADIYIYGFEVLLSSLFSTILIILIGVLIGEFAETVAFFIVFISLRSFTGGFHANTYLLCACVTTIVYAFVMLASTYVIINNSAFLVLLPVGVISIIIRAPIRNPYKALTEAEYMRHKITSVIIFIVFIASGIIMNHRPLLSRVVFFTLISDIILMFIKTKYKLNNIKTK